MDEPALIFNPAGIGFEMGTVNFTLNEAGSAPVPDIIAGDGFSTFIVDSNGVPHVDDTNTTPQCQVQHTGTAISFCAVSVSGVIGIMIIGAPNASNIYYAAANNSVANTNGPHNPFIIGDGGSYGRESRGPRYHALLGHSCAYHDGLGHGV